MDGLDLSSLGQDALFDREWLAVNKIGGYASSTIPGLNSRKYHGLLVAAMSPPVRRMVLLSRVEETVVCDGWRSSLACNEYPGTIAPRGDQSLRAFCPVPFPRWAYQGEGWTVEKTLRLISGENTVVLSYTLLGGDKPIDLELRPLLALRAIHQLAFQRNGQLKVEPKDKTGRHLRVPATTRTPEVFVAHDGVFSTAESCWYLNTIYRREQERGYAGLEDLWNPGIIRWTLAPGQTVNFVCSADPINLEHALAVADKQLLDATVPSPPTVSYGREMDALLAAADQFVLHVPSEDPMVQQDYVTAHYPWAPPSPRQTLMSFTGLFLVPGKYQPAARLLQSHAQRLVDGVLPTEFPEDGSAPTFRGADVSLWYVNAVHNYLRYTHDAETVRSLLTPVLQIIDGYQHGTSLGIRAAENGLLTSHVAGDPTTWMDAKVEDWVVTPRAGMPVELNALWYNAVCIAADLCERFGLPERGEELKAFAQSMRDAFNIRFWNDVTACCFDVINEHGNDQSIRPNQLLAMSLPYPVLEAGAHHAVLEKVMTELVTPFGVRTLSPADPCYQKFFRGNIVSRDRAYHQGSAFPWLLGPLVTAYVNHHGRTETARAEARKMLEPCIQYMMTDGLGQLCELFDGEKPHRPGGSIASAAAVAEVLRAYAEDVLDLRPAKVLSATSPALTLSYLEKMPPTARAARN